MEAIRRYNLIRSKFPYSEFAALSDLRIADAYFAQEKYATAVEQYRTFIKLYAEHPQVIYAMGSHATASNVLGVWRSNDGGDSWTKQTYPTAQMYRVSISKHFPYFVCGGQQDNSTICVPSRDWKHVNVLGGGQYGFAAGGGESGYVTNDPLNPEIFYAGSYGGTLDRYDRTTGQARAINVLPDNPMGYSASEVAERFQWTFPIVFDPHDPKSLYVTSQHVWRSRNEGQSWERISPDLTLADPKTLGPSGGPITRDQTGVETYSTVFALAPSRRERGLMAESTHSLISAEAPRSAIVRISPEMSLSSMTRLRCGMASRSSNRKIFGRTLLTASLLIDSSELSSVSRSFARWAFISRR